MNDNDFLFRPMQLGAITTPHRIFMAPLTRGRATERVPNALMATYYGQRASAGLIISEVGPSPIAATGEAHTPAGKKPYVVPRALAKSETLKLIKMKETS